MKKLITIVLSLLLQVPQIFFANLEKMFSVSSRETNPRLILQISFYRFTLQMSS